MGKNSFDLFSCVMYYLLSCVSIVYSSISEAVNSCRARKRGNHVRFLSWAYMEGSPLPSDTGAVMFDVS